MTMIEPQQSWPTERAAYLATVFERELQNLSRCDQARVSHAWVPGGNFYQFEVILGNRSTYIEFGPQDVAAAGGSDAKWVHAFLYKVLSRLRTVDLTTAS